MKSIRKLILECNRRDLYEKEESEHCEHMGHKDILDVVDTITIVSAEDSTILQMSWHKFDSRFKENSLGKSTLDIGILRTIMQTNVSDYLIKMPVFETLSNSKLELISRLCHYSIEKKGAVICKEGDRGEEVFILLSGEVKVEAMASKRMVELFEEGILSPLENKTSRSTIDHKNNNINVSNHNSQENASTKAASRQDSLIRRRQTLMRAGHNCRRERIEKMQLSSLVEQEDTNDNVIESNSRRISRLDIPDPNHTVELARFKAGEYFGEISTFIELPRTATVTATTNVLMVSISKTSFRALYHTISPGLEKDIEVMVKRHTLQTLLQTKSPFLEVIGNEDAARMADFSTIKTVKEGDIIFRQDDEADDFYFVYSGQLSVLKTKPIEIDESTENRKQMCVGMLYSGDYFGEMALLNNTRRLATIIATSTTVLISITREHFYLCFQETPDLIAEFLVRMKGHQVDLKSILDYSKSRASFSEFLESINCHILSCYEEIEAFERELEHDSNSIGYLDKASSIVNKYIRKGAPRFIEIESVHESFVLAVENKSSINKEFFSTFQYALEKKMEEELLPQFKETVIFATLEQRMRTYDEIDVKLLS